MNFPRVDFSKLPDSVAGCALLEHLANAPVKHSPRVVDKPLALYGAGNLGKLAKTYFARMGVPVQYVVDTKAEAWRRDPFWEGISILHPDEIPNQSKKSDLLAVCVGITEPHSQLHAKLASAGWQDPLPFYDIAEAYRDRHPLSNGWFWNHPQQSDIAETCHVLERWGDDVSRAHHMQFMAWHRLREDWIFEGAPITTDNRYFIHEIVNSLHDHEAFADIGAHHGEVSLHYLNYIDPHCQQVWAIEADRGNMAQLRHHLSQTSESNRNKITPLITALGSEKGSSRFYEGLDYASQFSSMGQDNIRVETLDNLSITPTFIKLHLEGWELDVLKGGLHTLLRHRPLITATSYHNQLGLWEFPKWLMDHLPDYQFLMRLHGWCGTSAVVYALPLERSVDTSLKCMAPPSDGCGACISG